ncbi:MAG: hypothetical protein ABSH15_01415 [Verrucomicrobiota bacterium]|jgi:hypothetical protein
MKTPTHQNQMVRRPFILAVLLAGIFLVPAVRAQPAAPNVNSRFLLIFDTSSDMQRRLPAVQKALNDILAASTNGQLHSGDSIGVWTFDQDLHVGQFPLQHWEPDNAGMITSNITAFVGKQRYTKTTGFDALLPLLNQVVLGSERLTVLIFCDGQGEIHGTPYDVGINKIFQQRQSERQKARLPIVIGLRSQHGQYTGCMVSFPPQPVSLPQFPPLPPPAPPAPTPAPPGPPRSSVPSLIIVGTTITNRVPPPVPKPVLTNPPPMVITSTPAPVVTNEVKPPAVVPLMQTSAVPAQPKIAAAPLTMTNAITLPPESPGIGRKGALAIGVAFLAGGLVVFMLRRTRKTGGDNPSDSSMKKD